MAKWFFGSGFAAEVDATQCSGSASIATADSAIAVPLVAIKPGSINDVAPTAATSEARKDDWTIGTGSGNIDIDKPAGRA